MPQPTVSPSTFMEDMESIFNRDQFADLFLLVEGKMLYLNQAIVSKGCQKLCSMITETRSGGSQSQPLILQAPGLTFETATSIFKFFYCGELEVSKENAYDIGRAAEFLELDHIVEFCNYKVLSKSLKLKDTATYRPHYEGELRIRENVAMYFDRDSYSDVKFRIVARNDNPIATSSGSGADNQSDPHTLVSLLLLLELRAHKAVLACRSNYFKSLFASGMLESQGVITIDITTSSNNNSQNNSNDHSYQDTHNNSEWISAFCAMIEYLYTDKINEKSLKSPDCLLELIPLANQYDIPRLVELCEWNLSRLLNFSPSAADSIIDYAPTLSVYSEIHQAHQLKMLCEHVLMYSN